MAAVLPRMKPAFKVAGDSHWRRKGRGRGQTEYETVKNPWERYRLKLLPKRINGRWYKPGAWVYRKFVMTPGGGYYKYGDDFDYIRGR